MPNALFAILGLVVAVGNSTAAYAQTGSAAADSLRHYELSEVVVGGAAEDGRVVQVGAVRRVALASIVRADAPTVAGLARLMPSAHVQTNSRGESLIYLRNAGERQVAIFLDGALLNIPWDNRLDLAAIPSSILGGIKVTQGAGSVLFGPNVLGGVVSLATRSIARDGSLSEVTLSGGSGRSSRVDGMHLRRKGKGTLLIAGGFNRSSGITLAENSGVLSGQSADELRTNTDRRLAHGFARWSREGERMLLGISLLHVDAAKGVAAEGHLDPSVDRVRYWRYPSWRTSMLSANLVAAVSQDFTVRGSAWASRFSQKIEQFSDGSYATLDETEDDEDLSAGFHAIAERNLSIGTWRTSLSGLVSSHDQTDRTLEGGVSLAQLSSVYRQATWSLGSEYQAELGQGTVGVLGFNLDRMSTPVTGDKPARGATNAWGATATIDSQTRSGWRLHATLGRKVRFPTMRELFGTALRSFLINESLKPESAWLADVGFSRVWGSGQLELTAFLNRTLDTIDQVNVIVEGERLRQRMNISGSRVLGLEVQAAIQPSNALTVDVSATVMDPVVVGDPERRVLTEKPELLGTIVMTFQPGRRGVYSVEGVYTGRAYGLLPDNTVQELPGVLQLNLRGSFRHFTSNGVFGELFVRLNNLTDQAVFPQLGLPGPGRAVQVGLSLAV